MSATYDELLDLLRVSTDKTDKRQSKHCNRPSGVLTKPTEGAFVSNVSSPEGQNRKNTVPLTSNQKRMVSRWLDSIEEHDEPTRAEVLRQCDTDPRARAWHLARAQALSLPENVIPLSPVSGLPLANCSTCRHQERDTINPDGGCSFCKVREVYPALPHVKRHCDKREPD